jgi:hypothetical protein
MSRICVRQVKQVDFLVDRVGSVSATFEGA